MATALPDDAIPAALLTYWWCVGHAIPDTAFGSSLRGISRLVGGIAEGGFKALLTAGVPPG